MDTENMIREYINEEILNGDSPVDIDDDLLSDGMVDSLSMIRLIAYIEEKHQIQIPPEDLVIEHFQTIRAITNYLKKCQE